MPNARANESIVLVADEFAGGAAFVPLPFVPPAAAPAAGVLPAPPRYMLLLLLLLLRLGGAPPDPTGLGVVTEEGGGEATKG